MKCRGAISPPWPPWERQRFQNELAQQAAQMNAAAEPGVAVPEPQRIRPTPPCEFPRKCDSK